MFQRNFGVDVIVNSSFLTYYMPDPDTYNAKTYEKGN